ncbi:hypothetical protein AXX12_06125 [Anaerosporomusa subterranea]|uniref:Uncharacterized protein n=1 Tax=Anaerosporomusa subterranea TaxID=1794912 RepID=A0A154BQ01_ANASB|nr:hypothetical protein AXX12_06125 [Anaerosporomusa subterranea]
MITQKNTAIFSKLGTYSTSRTNATSAIIDGKHFLFVKDDLPFAQAHSALRVFAANAIVPSFIISFCLKIL